MPGCAVACCTMYNRKSKNCGITYHSFPKDVCMQKVWISKCKRKDAFNVLNARICSQHFTDEDYIRDLKAELLGLPPKKILKSDAVPSILIPSTLNKITCNNDFLINEDSEAQSSMKQDRCIRNNNREIRKRAHETLESLSPKKRKMDQATLTEQPYEEKEMFKHIKLLEAENNKLNSLCEKLKLENKRIRLQLQSCKKELEIYKKNEKNISETKNAIGKLFTQNQINYLISGKKRAKWNKTEICQAIALRAVSKRCYTYLKMTLGYPLPGITTLQKWIKCSLRCRPGIIHDAIHLMKAQNSQFSEAERLCVLSFDEMNIDSRMVYDRDEDRIVGPHSNVQIVMVRGLYKNWKQPVFYDFDFQMNAATLKNIIGALDTANYRVVAIVSDLGGKNNKVWNELNISFLNSNFPNPKHAQKRIWVFADVPHLYKLLRNHYVDDGFIFPGGIKIDKTTIEKLLAADSAEMKLCPKLSAYHLYVTGRDRQRVFLAMQLFSNTTAQAIRKVLPEEEESARFIELVNNSFDILNARNPNDKNELAQGFGLHFKRQDDILRQFYDCIENMKVGKRKSNLPFQKGFMITIQSLFGLYNDLKSFNMPYILTSHLNQDCLENFFSRIRGIGHFYDTPLPTEIKYRIRLLLLGGASISNLPLSNATPVSIVPSENIYLTSCLVDNTLVNISQEMDILENDDQELRNIVLSSSTLNSSSSSISKNFINEAKYDCPVEAFRYLAGYIAHRCRKVDKSLAIPTGQLLRITPNSNCSGWIETLSKGGLLVPSDEWLEKIKEFELLFLSINGTDISRENMVIKKLCKRISERFPEIQPEIIKEYARTRTFIRLRHLNNIFKLKKAVSSSIRKAKKWAASSK